MSQWPYGSQQSPIRLETAKAVPVVFPVDYLVVDYPNQELPGKFNHSNHNFYFDSPPTIRFAGITAPLERVHIHSRSEHWLDGLDFDFEIHFVHPFPSPSTPDAVTGDSTHVVLGVFFKERRSVPTPLSIRALNSALKANAALRSDENCSVGAAVNPVDFLPSNRSQFFRYEGSLTTPDGKCFFKERVSWVIYPHLIEVDPSDVEELKACAQEGAREPQEINRRFVLRNFS
ncbi:MAG: carbonic anhydrase family protein [Pirellulales bacterium]